MKFLLLTGMVKEVKLSCTGGNVCVADWRSFD